MNMTMQSIVFDKTGEPEAVLRLAELPRPTPRDGEVLVKVDSRPIHPADLAFVRGQYRIRPSYPQVAGLEGAGVTTGGGAIAAGTRVAFRWPGTWAEFAAVPVERITMVPAWVSSDAACQFSLNPVTAWALLDESRVVAGDTILLTAGASTVSNLVAAIAIRRGIRVVGLVRGDAAQARPRAEAERLISVADPDLIGKINAVAGERRVTALLDSVGGSLVPDLLGTLAPGAHAIAYGVQDRAAAAVTNALLIYGNLTWKGFGIDRWLSELAPDVKQRMVDELWTMMRDGSLRLPVAARHRLADFLPALANASASGRAGKVLLGAN
jgi:NADPH:quinone reductase-like Zn-dependent oxidoreductase